MAMYKCIPCGYIYDEKLGDPRHGIKPNTLWKNLPSDWVCPLCGVGKDMLKKSSSESFYILHTSHSLHCN